MNSSPSVISASSSRSFLSHLERRCPSLCRRLFCCALAVTSGSAFAATIPNPSFEANNFTLGTGTIAENNNTPITGWSANDPAHIGLSPRGADETFADNGVVPNGTHVAFLQSVGGSTSTLSTTITGLVAGTHYRLQFRYNRRAATGATGASYRLNGAPAVPLGSFNAVNTTGVHTTAYLTHTTFFIATGPTAVLELSNKSTADTALLVDDFSIVTGATLQVTNANNDGPGSLRQTLITAAASPDFNVVTFAPALSGQSIVLLSGITNSHFGPGGVAIDATALPKSITIDGKLAGFSLFSPGHPVHFRGLTFTGGGNIGAAILSTGAATTIMASRCTFTGNGTAATLTGGAILNGGGWTLLSQCTITGNSATPAGGNGGALSLNPSTVGVVDHCTIAFNTATSSGGGINNSFALLTVSNSIVSGNTAPSTSGPDIFTTGSGARTTFVGANLCADHDFAAGGGEIDTANVSANSPNLDTLLRDNGGPTKTLALLNPSAARNASSGSVITSDQRGKPILGPSPSSAPDIGAYEVQRGSFTIAGGAATEGTTVVLSVNRVDGFEGAVSVKFSTFAGSAGAADFTPLANFTVNFGDAVTSASVGVATTGDALPEPNETFTASLSAPSAGTTLGTPSTGVGLIQDDDSPADTVPPALAPTITSPAAGAVINLQGPVTFTGQATDERAVQSVTTSFFGDGVLIATTSATLVSPNAASTQWSSSFTPVTPVTNLTIEVQATDAAGQPSPIATRTVKILPPLTVAIKGNGSVTPGFAPLSFRELGQSLTITATPVAGHVFTGWTVVNATAAQIGVPAVDLDRPTLTFLHRLNLQLIANFVPSPFTNSVTGNYKGLITPSGGTPSNNSTEGLFSATVNPLGAFSGTITIDGLVLGFSGVLDHTGVARFGTSRALFVRVARTGKPSLMLALHMDNPSGFLLPLLIGTVDQLNFRNEVVAQSEFTVTRAGFDGVSNPVDPLFLNTGSANAVYNVIFMTASDSVQPVAVFNGHPEFFPPGFGFGRLTLTKAGVVTLTDCTLADGTTGVTATTVVDSLMEAPLFLPLYNKTGFLRMIFKFAGAPASDVASVGDSLWLRPAQNTHHYHDGWPETLTGSLTGTKFSAPNGQSLLLKGTGLALNLPDANGNATLTFGNGQLSQTLGKVVNISTTDVVTKVPINDPTFTLFITRATGLFTGTFRHTDTTTVTFKGIILQKTSDAGGYGFFLTTPTVLIDYSGEAGAMTMFAEP